MSDDLSRLREVAEGATPGAWKTWGMSVLADQDGTSNYDTAVHVADTSYRDENGKPRTFDADYIATFDPPTVLALLDRLEAAEAVAARVEALIEEREAWAAEKSAELRERWPNSSWRTYAVGAVYGTADLRAAIEGKP